MPHRRAHYSTVLMQLQGMLFLGMRSKKRQVLGEALPLLCRH